MGFFGGKKPAPLPPTPEPTANDLGVVIHIMPKDFLGQEASLKMESLPVPPPIITPPPSVAQLAQGGNPPIAQAKRLPLWAWALISVIILLAIGGVVYVVLIKSQPQPVVAPPVVQQTLPITTPVTVPPVTVPNVPKVPTLSKDSDSDGLTDIEERMYGTDYRNPDSDHDTFLDGNEVFHRYDPNGLAPSTLLDTGAVKIFSDTNLPFTLTYPTSWKPSSDVAKKTVTFKTPNLAEVVVSWGTKDKDLTVEDWVLKNVAGVDITTLQSSYTKEGYYTLRSKDDLVAYIDGGTTVYVLTYDLNGSLDISYTQTFAMMVNSFIKKP